VVVGALYQPTESRGTKNCEMNLGNKKIGKTVKKGGKQGNALSKRGTWLNEFARRSNRYQVVSLESLPTAFKF